MSAMSTEHIVSRWRGVKCEQSKAFRNVEASDARKYVKAQNVFKRYAPDPVSFEQSNLFRNVEAPFVNGEASDVNISHCFVLFRLQM